MSGSEFSDAFDTLVNSYGVSASFGNQVSRQDIVFDEYEKSLFLTQAQEELVISLYTGKNPYGESFESTEELREYLKPLIKGTHKSLVLAEGDDKQVIRYGGCKVYRASNLDNVIGIIYEEVTLEDNALGCKDDIVVPVVPVKHDEIAHIIRNPFRGPSTRRVLRVDNIDNGTKMELLSKYSLRQDSYYVRYVRRPFPIVLSDLGEASVEGMNTQSNYNGEVCELPKQLHSRILELAVRKAVQSKGYQFNNQNRDN